MQFDSRTRINTGSSYLCHLSTQRRRRLIGLSCPKVGYYTVFLVRVLRVLLLLIPFMKVLIKDGQCWRCCIYVGSRKNRRHILKNDPFQGKEDGGRGYKGGDLRRLAFTFFIPLLCRFPLSLSSVPASSMVFPHAAALLFTGISLRPGPENPSDHAYGYIYVRLSFTALPIVSETGRLSACCHAGSRTRTQPDFPQSVVSARAVVDRSGAGVKGEEEYCTSRVQVESKQSRSTLTIQFSIIETSDRQGGVVHTRTGRLLPGLPADRMLLRACTYCATIRTM